MPTMRTIRSHLQRPIISAIDYRWTDRMYVIRWADGLCSYVPREFVRYYRRTLDRCLSFAERMEVEREVLYRRLYLRRTPDNTKDVLRRYGTMMGYITSKRSP